MSRKMSLPLYLLITFIALCFSSSALADESYQNDLVVDLPGAPAHSFRHYSGYVTVDEEKGKALFYWLVEVATGNAAEKPLTLWLAGGPGCSSVGGAMSELGPFFPSKDGQTLTPNAYSWHQVSNMLFVEQPVGVGFSYTNETGAPEIGDHQSAKDVHHFLTAWFEKFPHYQGRDFFIAGESYAGHYVPHLAYHILENQPVAAHGDKDANKLNINFKGFAVGNAWTDTETDNFGTVDFWWDRALISTETYEMLYKHCNFSVDFYDYYMNDFSLCSNVTATALNEMGNIDLYAIYFKQCVGSAQAPARKLFSKRRVYAARSAAAAAAAAAAATAAGPLPHVYDPCIENEVEAYLNRPAVQRALHANTTKLTYPWNDCSNVLKYSEYDVESTVLGLYAYLLRAGIRIWVYSGDVDGVVPVAGTRKWIAKLRREGHLSHSKPWAPWYLNHQVGGHTEEYNDGAFTFVTVRNAGHEVPYTQPERALALFSSFLHGRALPSEAKSRRPAQEGHVAAS